MIHHVLSFILGGFIIVCMFFGLFWFFAAVDSFEDKVKNTKPYKVVSYMSRLLIWLFLACFGLFTCWALGDWIIGLIG